MMSPEKKAMRATRPSSPRRPHKVGSTSSAGDVLSAVRAELRATSEELQRTRLELDASRERYFELYDLAPIAYITVDAHGRIVEANLAAARLFGIDRARIYKKAFASFVSRTAADELHRFLHEASSGGGRRGHELALRTVDGRSVEVHLDATAHERGGIRGRPDVCFRCVLIDMSNLRHAEAARRESEERFRLIAETIDDVFFVEEEDGRLTYVSAAYERVFGLPRARAGFRRSTWATAIHQDDRERIATARARMKRGEPLDEEYRVCRPDGQVRWVRERVYEVDGDDRLVSRRTVGIIHDITTERQLAERLQQAQKMEAVGALASGVAHDFNNVLHTVLGFSSLALDEEGLSEHVRNLLERVVTSAKRGGQLTSQLMGFARKERPAPTALAFDPAVRAAAALVERLVTEQVRVELDLRAPNLAVHADPVQLEQILMNLATNARDAMPEGGKLRIATKACALVDAARRPGLRVAEAYVSMIVADDGDGMDEETQRRIFEPFFTTKPTGKGTGLGLPTVFAVVQQLGGHIEVESSAGQGTALTILLPAHESARIAAPGSQRHLQAIDATVLLVEDEPLVRLTVRSYLEDLGAKVIEVEDVVQARVVFEQQSAAIDVVVTDVVMPIMTGPRLVETFWQTKPALPVLFISANPPAELRERREGRSHLVLPKPFGRSELAAKLQQLVGLTTSQ